jgi:hypothetical protein
MPATIQTLARNIAAVRAIGIVAMIVIGLNIVARTVASFGVWIND